MAHENRQHIPVALLLEEDGLGLFESDDGQHSIDLPMHYLGQSPDGIPREFRLTESSEVIMIYEDDGGITVIASEADQAIYIQTSSTPVGYEIQNVHIFQKHTKQ